MLKNLKIYCFSIRQATKEVWAAFDKSYHNLIRLQQAVKLVFVRIITSGNGVAGKNFTGINEQG